MVKFIIIFLLFLYSCGYPDIDTVPEFENMDITIQDSIELCKIANSDNKNKEINLELDKYDNNNHLRKKWLNLNQYSNNSECFEKFYQFTNRL